jgi:hypothetical protein
MGELGHKPIMPTGPASHVGGRSLPLLCRFLGRLHDVAIDVRRRQASEKRQGTKSRLVGSGGCSRLYGDLAAAGVAGVVHWGNRIGWQRRAAGRWRTAGRAERASRRWPAVVVSQG